MPQLPYSPDLAPCDFFLFPKLKRPMKGRRYATLDEIKTASKEELKKIFKNDFLKCFEDWKNLWHNFLFFENCQLALYLITSLLCSAALALNPAKKKNAKNPIVSVADLEKEDKMVMKRYYETMCATGHPALLNLHQDLMHFISKRSELVRTLLAEVENLSGTLEAFAELDQVMEANQPSSQTDPIKPATPAPAALPAKKPAPTLPAPAPTKRKQPEAHNPPAKRTNLPRSCQTCASSPFQACGRPSGPPWRKIGGPHSGYF
ncbi:hypothetical protein LAZ67_19001039 [Cordylochernes scorpioides]|uniref:Uncharacterized protein n=1 Tax=Cordylochernes scorpioides TaxID=51811 RepID=A0ABY6LIC5_9ARAC|nr:hypothetical protein LAZ67_19001039 [Cordylochernes scorpioides]